MESQIEKVLKEYKDNCCSYADLHQKASHKYSMYNSICNVVSILITAGSATFNMVINNNELSETKTISLIVSGCLLYVSTMINTAQQSFNFEKLAETNRTISSRFVLLGNNIKKFLAIQEVNNQDVIEYFKWVNDEYENIISGSPLINVNLDKTGGPVPENSKSENSKVVRQEPQNKIHDLKDIKYELERFMVNSYTHSTYSKNETSVDIV